MDEYWHPIVFLSWDFFCAFWYENVTMLHFMVQQCGHLLKTFFFDPYFVITVAFMHKSITKFVIREGVSQCTPLLRWKLWKPAFELSFFLLIRFGPFKLHKKSSERIEINVLISTPFNPPSQPSLTIWTTTPRAPFPIHPKREIRIPRANIECSDINWSTPQPMRFSISTEFDPKMISRTLVVICALLPLCWGISLENLERCKICNPC